MSHKTTLLKAARTGGNILKKYFGRTLNKIEKSTAWDFQTEADTRSEWAILKILKREFPKYNIHSEENGKIHNNSEYTFVVDPLDGTNNFTVGIPNFSVSIGLMRGNEAIAGVVYQPISNQIYYAERKKGASLNGKKIGVNSVTDPKKITIAYQCGYKKDRKHLSEIMARLIKSKHSRIMLSWSMACDYCLLAQGKIESVITDSGSALYDYAAGKLIALEAGAKVVDFSGKKEKNYKNDTFIISNRDKTNEYMLDIAGKVLNQK